MEATNQGTVRPTRRAAVGAVAVALLAAGIGCSGTRQAAEPPPPDILALARGTSYPLDYLGAGTIQLTDAAYQDSAGELDVKLVRSAVGDIDGDSLDDAAVVLASQTGGSGTFVDLFAVLARGRSSVTRGPASLGDRVKVDSLRVADHRVLIHLVVHGPDDPLCCPTRPVVENFVLRGDTLTRKPQELP